VFFTRPLSCGILILAVVVVVFPLISKYRSDKKAAKAAEQETAN